jgi:uncharacterized protein
MIKYTITIITITILASCSKNNPYSIYLGKYRAEKKSEMLKDERFPLKNEKDFAGIKYYKANDKYRVNCSFQKTEGAKPFDLPTYSGKTRPYIEYGRLSCPVEKHMVQLSIYRSIANLQIYKNHLFLPFKDLTTDRETYGGGRYIDLQLDDIKDNAIEIDFNKCYNPWCAYSDGFNCPIPPKENQLNIAIKAGEKNYEGPHKTAAHN